MAELKTIEESKNNPSLQIIFKWIALEHPEDWEGWVEYSLELKNGDQTISAITGTILDGDIGGVLHALEKGRKKRVDFEPLEPDFFLTVSPALDSIHGHDAAVSIFIDEGNRRREGYGDSGIGLRLLVDKNSMKGFIETLRQERDAIVQGKKYSRWG